MFNRGITGTPTAYAFTFILMNEDSITDGAGLGGMGAELDGTGEGAGRMEAGQGCNLIGWGGGRAARSCAVIHT